VEKREALTVGVRIAIHEWGGKGVGSGLAKIVRGNKNQRGPCRKGITV